MILYYIFVLSLAFVDHPWFGLGFGGITVEKIVGAAALLYAIVHLVLRADRPAFLDTWPARAFLVFFLVQWGSYLAFGAKARADQAFVFHPFNFLLLMFMTISVVDSMRRLRWALLAAVGSVAWASLYMLREWQGGIRAYGYGYRPGYVVGDPNYFASSALLCLPLAFYFSRSISQRWIRRGCMASVLLILAGITVSASRGGFLGMMVAAVMMVWHSKRRVRTFIGMGVLLGAFLVVSPSSPLDRLLHPSRSDEGAMDMRTTLWGAAWRMFCDNPLTGVGYGNFRYNSAQYFPEGTTGTNHLVHNQYLELLAQTGLPGLLSYAAMFVASFVTLNRVRRTAQRSGSPLLADAALGIQIGLAGFSASVFFLSAGFLRLYWFMISISACLPALAAGEASKQKRRRLRATQRSLVGAA
jgi:probable O-glycosylation ligase (exosortase A-associated)